MGSSAVPVKRNPTKSERITSLSKLLRSQVQIAFENIPHWHERDLSNSANERFILPMCSILLDEMLETMINVIQNLQINVNKIKNNLYFTKGQIFAEFLLKGLIKKGIPRFKAYRDVQRVAFDAHKKGIEYIDAVRKDPAIYSHLTEKEIKTIFTPENHLGASSTIINNVSRSVQKMCKKFI
jgi:adenylosuccinate lyase